jgi:hypothetical protein
VGGRGGDVADREPEKDGGVIMARIPSEVSDLSKSVDDEVARFFQSLGYEVDWDFDSKGRWYEIGDDKGVFCQIDSGVPLAHIIEDMACFADGKDGTSASDYEIRGTHSERGRKLLRAVRDHKRKAA